MIFRGGDCTMNEDRSIQIDRMRFIKNSLSSNLAILAILFDVLYFVSIYQSNVGNYYYNYLIGISVVYNLVFLLTAFLSSEGVKNYKKSYSYLLLVLGVIQIVRIFILPMQAHSAVISIGSVDTIVMGNKQFYTLVVYLILSAVCLVASGVTNYVKCTALEAHIKTLAEKPI